MRKILFLDMDGVVLSGQALWATRNHRYLPPRKIGLLNMIVERTGCEFVMTSVWRNDPSVRCLMKAAGFIGAWAEPWKTPHGQSFADDHTRRGREIAEWFHLVQLDPEETNYVILDDDSDMLPEQMPYFLKCQFKDGITRGHVINADGILNRERLPLDANRIPRAAAL